MSFRITQGQTANLELAITDDAGEPLDLTGASFETKVRAQDGEIVTFANAKHTADADQVANKGKVVLALDATDTASIGLGSQKDLVTKITTASAEIYFNHYRDDLTVLPAYPLD